MKALSVFFWLTCAAVGVWAKPGKDTLSVYFPLDIFTLDEQAVRSLKNLCRSGEITEQTMIEIVGYADFLAAEDYNLILSGKRARQVKMYLLDCKNIREENIRLVVGKGEVRRTDTASRYKGMGRGIPGDRRVDVVYYHKKSHSPRRDYDTFISLKPRHKLPAVVASSDPDFSVDHLEAGQSFVLKNIYFPMGRHFPKETSYAELNKLVELMQENRNLKIQVEGHVCCITGVPDAYDLDSKKMDLSHNRAKFIYEYMVARGVDPLRLRYIGFGKSKPVVADEQTEEDASANRRVEIRILSK